MLHQELFFQNSVQCVITLGILQRKFKLSQTAIRGHRVSCTVLIFQTIFNYITSFGGIALPFFLASMNSMGEYVEITLSRINIADTNELAEAVESWRGA